MFTKRAAVRAVELSIGAFCTEFRCEQLCDDDMFFGSGSTIGLFILQFEEVQRTVNRFGEPRTGNVAWDENKLGGFW